MPRAFQNHPLATLSLPFSCLLPLVSPLLWPWGTLNFLLSLIYLHTIKTRTVAMVTRGIHRPHFCQPKAAIGIIPHMWASLCFGEGLPQIPRAAKCVLVPFLLAGQNLSPLALWCLWLCCDRGCEEAECRSKPCQAGHLLTAQWEK